MGVEIRCWSVWPRKSGRVLVRLAGNLLMAELLVECCWAQAPGSYSIDPQSSRIEIRVYRGGSLGGLGDNHVMVLGTISGPRRHYRGTRGRYTCWASRRRCECSIRGHPLPRASRCSNRCWARQARCDSPQEHRTAVTLSRTGGDRPELAYVRRADTPRGHAAG